MLNFNEAFGAVTLTFGSPTLMLAPILAPTFLLAATFLTPAFMLAPTFLKPAERLAPNFLVAATAFLAPSLIFKPTFLAPALTLDEPALILSPSLAAPTLTFLMIFFMVVGKAHFLPVNLTHILWVPAFPCLIMASNNFMVGVKRVIKVFIGLPVTPGAPWEAPLIILAKVLDWKHLVSSLIWTTTILLFLPHFNDLAALKSTITGPVATGFLTVTLTPM